LKIIVGREVNKRGSEILTITGVVLANVNLIN